MSQMGTVKSWFDTKGFGFIVQDGHTEDIFVHYTQIRMEGRRSLDPGQRVWFNAERRDKGLVASDVTVLLNAPAAPPTCAACGRELQS